MCRLHLFILLLSLFFFLIYFDDEDVFACCFPIIDYIEHTLSNFRQRSLETLVALIQAHFFHSLNHLFIYFFFISFAGPFRLQQNSDDI